MKKIFAILKILVVDLIPILKGIVGYLSNYIQNHPIWFEMFWGDLVKKHIQLDLINYIPKLSVEKREELFEEIMEEDGIISIESIVNKLEEEKQKQK